MKSGTMPRQGDIILVPFPFSDLSSSKRRPALVVSNDGYNRRAEDIIICGITSNPESREYSVSITNDDLVSGSMLADSRVKADKLFTIKKFMIVKNLAAVSDKMLDEVKDEMMKLFGF